ncbi:phosphodiester glycosidase family protein [Paenibacillus harenae]|uniref:phosphodiester glycosidase family protein n=1 Tax=Paenibacillus harenae TaxID=306543 RepID=UPI00278CD28D|nr:phosphodiester glycosidase family protein [Paenibacillus harenae]MDQ0063889.1 hypothetical protein [Paenibacillus harenae]
MAINYSYFEQGPFRVIKTHVSNLKNVVIKKPLCDTSYYGINGGFFAEPAGGYGTPPTTPLSINWFKGQTTGVCTYNGPSATDTRQRGTLVTFYDTATSKTLSVITRAKDINEIKQDLGANLDYRNIIGGGSLALNLSNSAWKTLHEDQEKWSVYGTLAITERSAIGLKVENGQHIAFLLISKNGNNESLYSMRDTLKELGCFDGIFLDGSGSAQMQVHANGALIQDRGSDGAPGRYIYNAVTLANTN